MGVGGVGGGNDDDIGTQTSRTISPYFRDGRPSEMMMVSKHHASSVGFPDSGGVGWGVGGMMTTLVHRHPEQYLHKSRFTRYLQYFRDAGPPYMMMVSKHHASSVGFLILGGWGGWGGMMTTLVHRHPEEYLHTFVMADHLK